jgi:hypothetical protein
MISKRKLNLVVGDEYYNSNCRNAEDSQYNSLLIISNMIDQVIEKQMDCLFQLGSIKKASQDI